MVLVIGNRIVGKKVLYPCSARVEDNRSRSKYTAHPEQKRRKEDKCLSMDISIIGWQGGLQRWEKTRGVFESKGVRDYKIPGDSGIL